MVFGDNKLTLQHSDGYGITFETLEALKLVNNHCDLLKVADAEEWAKTRYQYYNDILKLILKTCYIDSSKHLVSRGQTAISAQGVYHLQYKRPCRKGSGRFHSTDLVFTLSNVSIY